MTATYKSAGANYLAQRAAYLQAEAEANALRCAAVKSISRPVVGQILVSRWGSEQTNIGWHQVVGLKGSTTVIVRRVAGHRFESGTKMFGSCVPVADNFVGGEIEKRFSNGAIKIDEFERARPWDGNPVRWSAYA